MLANCSGTTRVENNWHGTFQFTFVVLILCFTQSITATCCASKTQQLMPSKLVHSNVWISSCLVIWCRFGALSKRIQDFQTHFCLCQAAKGLTTAEQAGRWTQDQAERPGAARQVLYGQPQQHAHSQQPIPLRPRPHQAKTFRICYSIW